MAKTKTITLIEPDALGDMANVPQLPRYIKALVEPPPSSVEVFGEQPLAAKVVERTECGMLLLTMHRYLVRLADACEVLKA